MRVITRIYDHRSDALEAVHELERMGVPTETVSVIASNRDAWFDRTGDGKSPLSSHDRDKDGRDDRAEGAIKGAATGGVLGAGAGLLAGLGLLAIPGIGQVVAAGWVASTLAGAATGAVAGGAVGGLVTTLTEAGIPEEQANVFSEGVRRGGTLVMVRADVDEVDEIERALDRYRPSDVGARGQEYRAGGWTRFDPDAPPPM